MIFFFKKISLKYRLKSIYFSVTDEFGNILPVRVYARAYIYYLQNLDTHNLEYQMQLLLELRYHDPRLKFAVVAPTRTSPIKGEAYLREKIWVPHIFFQNEK